MRMEVSRDNGQTWAPMGNVRTTPGGLDQGQTDVSASGKVALGASTTTVQLGTVPAGKTRYYGDLFFQCDVGSCDVQLQVGGVSVWIGNVGTTPIGQGRRARPISCPAGSAVTIVFAANNGNNGYFNLGSWEE